MPYTRELVIARLTISLVRSIALEILDSRRFGTNADDVILCCAIFIGQAERKPMTAAKLAQYAGMPRPTVVRKLRQFARGGIVSMSEGGQVSLTADILSAETRLATESNARAITRAAAALSKMDTSRIAQRKPM